MPKQWKYIWRHCSLIAEFDSCWRLLNSLLCTTVSLLQCSPVSCTASFKGSPLRGLLKTKWETQLPVMLQTHQFYRCEIFRKICQFMLTFCCVKPAFSISPLRIILTFLKKWIGSSPSNYNHSHTGKKEETYSCSVKVDNLSLCCSIERKKLGERTGMYDPWCLNSKPELKSDEMQFTARVVGKGDGASWLKGAVQHPETTAEGLGSYKARWTSW